MQLSNSASRSCAISANTPNFHKKQRSAEVKWFYHGKSKLLPLPQLEFECHAQSATTVKAAAVLEHMLHFNTETWGNQYLESFPKHQIRITTESSIVKADQKPFSLLWPQKHPCLCTEAGVARGSWGENCTKASWNGLIPKSCSSSLGYETAASVCSWWQVNNSKLTCQVTQGLASCPQQPHTVSHITTQCLQPQRKGQSEKSSSARDTVLQSWPFSSQSASLHSFTAFSTKSTLLHFVEALGTRLKWQHTRKS